jgi:hypothetical protein
MTHWKILEEGNVEEKVHLTIIKWCARIQRQLVILLNQPRTKTRVKKRKVYFSFISIEVIITTGFDVYKRKIATS